MPATTALPKVDFGIAHRRRGVPRHAPVGGLSPSRSPARARTGGALIVEWRERRPEPRHDRGAGHHQPRAHRHRFRSSPARSGSRRSSGDRAPRARGLDARLASMLCYAGWWVTGLVFLFAERQHRGVRFHAAQSLVVFGMLSVVLFLCGGASAVAFFVVGRRLPDCCRPSATCCGSGPCCSGCSCW